MTFTGRVVLITGAGAGIGRGLAGAFARAGATVVVNDVDGASAHRVASTLPGATVEVADIADVTAVRAMVEQVVDRHGRLDVAVANAGITRFGAFLDYEPDDFDRVVAVNLRGTYFTAQAAARAMVAAGTGGRILLLGSVAGVRTINGLSVYGATKAAIGHLAAVLALELGGHGITVNAVAPGATLTERTALERPDYAEAWASVAPDRRTGSVDDVAAVALFLAGDAAGHVTGQTVVVDGGWTTTGHVPDGY